ncbi:MAG TPA: isoprenylcysteine carboxylmethyltransferase family protein [Bryobacteraceae bacterium]|nr:isoprenylcysteine carboxylmethyltransferase family protein [Bryobacteraceae bacterium]
MNKNEPARRKLLPPKGLLLSLLVQLPLVLWSWPPMPTRVPALMGIAMLLGGIVLNIWAERLFRKSGTGVCPLSPVSRLINDGPYRITRNPMYLGMVLISASASLIAGLFLNLCSAAALAVWLHLRFILPEEKFLRETLGVGYLEYASRTPRWLGLPGPQVTQTEQSSRAV